ncbi:hypothetical protein [Agrococcus sp. ARC_14]|uniref:hypothetical protein n=1 Tax=Agrococcus sp. ARC_14 TaxID=2919927 RepID=UPI001F05ADC5|nr:hypothetical protein [Agrococcus sp. ARC_14]MCH1881698.1 hypothetical protein [Agrococcus sp. ARC_14]
MKRTYLEVWGDTVDGRHLLYSILIGVGLGTPAYLLAAWLFGQAEGIDQTLSKSYALLVGLAACVLTGVVSARLFPPKRILVEADDEPGSRDVAMDSIEQEFGPLGDPDELPAAVLREVKELGIYEDLARQHAKNAAKEVTR